MYTLLALHAALHTVLFFFAIPLVAVLNAARSRYAILGLLVALACAVISSILAIFDHLVSFWINLASCLVLIGIICQTSFEDRISAASKPLITWTSGFALAYCCASALAGVSARLSGICAANDNHDCLGHRLGGSVFFAYSIVSQIFDAHAPGMWHRYHDLVVNALFALISTVGALIYIAVGSLSSVAEVKAATIMHTILFSGVAMLGIYGRLEAGRGRGAYMFPLLLIWGGTVVLTHPQATPIKSEIHRFAGASIRAMASIRALQVTLSPSTSAQLITPLALASNLVGTLLSCGSHSHAGFAAKHKLGIVPIFIYASFVSLAVSLWVKALLAVYDRARQSSYEYVEPPPTAKVLAAAGPPTAGHRSLAQTLFAAPTPMTAKFAVD